MLEGEERRDGIAVVEGWNRHNIVVNVGALAGYRVNIVADHT